MRAWILVLVLAAGCRDLPSGPRPTAVQPASGSRASATTVAIVGDGFHTLVRVNVDDESKSTVDDRFLARLGPHALEAVRHHGATRLEATVPAGLPPGSYELVVTDPRGSEGRLASAFTVLAATDARPDAPRDAGVERDGPRDARSDAPVDARPPDGRPPDLRPPDLRPPDATPWPTVVTVANDPFGDGTRFAYVFAHAGKVYLGPSKNGTGAMRMNADGSGLEAVSFGFSKDLVGNKSENTTSLPTSIGSTGCTKNTSACGPDNENGRGLFAAGLVQGTPWLFVGGARSAGDLDYVYATPDTGTSLAFRYVDLSPEMGPATEGFSALHVFKDRVYLGFPDTGGSKPYFVVLKTMPSSPGLDVASASQAENLAADDMPGLGGQIMIDTVADFADRLYLFNRGGCYRSTTATPASYATVKSDWAPCTPTSLAYTTKSSILPSATYDLEPADRAVPQVAVHQGRLYLARNTTLGPQLWACTPAATGSATDCDPGDWSLVAGDALGFTRLGNPGNGMIGLLVATSSMLYVGYNNLGGVRVYRTSASTPAEADFQAVGGAGLGQASSVRIFAGIAASFQGQGYVFVVVGDGVNGVRVSRIRN